jgi:hypothetical protein
MSIQLTVRPRWLVIRIIVFLDCRYRVQLSVSFETGKYKQLFERLDLEKCVCSSFEFCCYLQILMAEIIRLAAHRKQLKEVTACATKSLKVAKKKKVRMQKAASALSVEDLALLVAVKQFEKIQPLSIHGCMRLIYTYRYVYVYI